MCDTFTLIGLRGYDKTVMRKQREKEQQSGKLTSPSEPQFKQSMTMEEMERLGGCVPQVEADQGTVKQ